MDTTGIHTDWEVFKREGDLAFGAVRQVKRDHIVVYIENGGDVKIDARHIKSVHDTKVIVDCENLPENIRDMIRHAHDREE